MRTVYSRALIKPLYVSTSLGLYVKRVDFHDLFYDTICHFVKISHLKVITGYIFIHKPLVLKYQLVLRKYHVQMK